MGSRRRLVVLAPTACALALLAATGAHAATGGSWSAGTPAPVGISDGPWTLAQSGAVYPAAQGSTGLTTPYPTGYSGTPGVLPGYCASGGPSPESGLPVGEPAGAVLRMSPYYFPHVQRRADGNLEGFFDYRPKDVTEAIVAAESSDDGRTWRYQGMALGESPTLCPNGNQDTNLPTTNDDGQGHPFDITVGGVTYLYTLNRPSGDSLGSALLAHTIDPNAANPLATLPATEPVGLGGSTTTTGAGTVTAALGGASTSALPVASTAGAEMPGRVYLGGRVVQCSAATATAFTGCYAPMGTPISYAAGIAVTTDPVVPSTARATTGLTAPDGILGVLPASATPTGVPAGATTVLYVDKTTGTFTPTTAAQTVTLGSTPMPLPLTAPTTYAGQSFPITVYVGGASSVVPVTCTGTDAGGLTGCTAPSSVTVAAGNSIGSPGACAVDPATLAQIGEGSSKAKTLFKNNEDYVQVRAAYTTNGVDFHDVTPPAGVTGLASPTAQSGLRWVAPSGTVVTNPDGSLGIFYSAGQCTDGDSDAFGSLYYATSTDGLHWDNPTTIAATGTSNGTLSTDYTFAASRGDDANGLPSDPSGYYAGRIYSPSVVQDADGSWTMVFAGYRTPKPLPSVGTSLGRGSSPYVVGSRDAALYRTIMSVQLTPPGSGSSPVLPEAPYAVGLPLVALAAGGTAFAARRRRSC